MFTTDGLTLSAAVMTAREYASSSSSSWRKGACAACRPSGLTVLFDIRSIMLFILFILLFHNNTAVKEKMPQTASCSGTLLHHVPLHAMQESALRCRTGQMGGSRLYSEQGRGFSHLEHFRKLNVRFPLMEKYRNTGFFTESMKK
jgi:hypothetical protein